ncbi:hypothetical protein B0H17DRAFT_1052039 [Mycena rosella]|uniref:Uncharacterized protein n=1 Tax=Mycena rosella TaxID=1033263 RepID=A0AAD7DQJ2_MYCRO|nr:hypothetical protein B0H17DRAFT_1052039 [Mycena rosella]
MHHGPADSGIPKSSSLVRARACFSISFTPARLQVRTHAEIPSHIPAWLQSCTHMRRIGRRIYAHAAPSRLQGEARSIPPVPVPHGAPRTPRRAPHPSTALAPRLPSCPHRCAHHPAVACPFTRRRRTPFTLAHASDTSASAPCRPAPRHRIPIHTRGRDRRRPYSVPLVPQPALRGSRMRYASRRARAASQTTRAPRKYVAGGEARILTRAAGDASPRASSQSR